MPTDKYVLDVINAGRMKWFEVDKVTLGEIKARYLLEADEFLYFRKGEDWLKGFVDWLLALGRGPEQILELASACGKEFLDFTQTGIDALSQLSFKDCIDWYLRLAAIELARQHLLFLKKVFWNKFVKKARKVGKHLGPDFRILCKKSPENIDHLPRWRAMRTKVRFYKKNTDSGSHRFYLNEKGYAVFWRQGEGTKTRFYGFEGTDAKVVKRLKAIFKKEWACASTPKIRRIKKKRRK